MNRTIRSSVVLVLIVLVATAATWAGKPKILTFDQVISDPGLEKWVRVQKTGKPFSPIRVMGPFRWDT